MYAITGGKILTMEEDERGNLKTIEGGYCNARNYRGALSYGNL